MMNEKRLTADLETRARKFATKMLSGNSGPQPEDLLEPLLTELTSLRQERDALYNRLVRDACACEHDGNVVKDPCEMHKEWREAEVTTLSRRLSEVEKEREELLKSTDAFHHEIEKSLSRRLQLAKSGLEQIAGMMTKGMRVGLMRYERCPAIAEEALKAIEQEEQ